MGNIYYRHMETPLGKLLAVEEDGKLIGLSSSGQPCESWECRETLVLKLTAEQLAEYFSGERTVFTVPLALKGTDFQKRIWQELLKIPYGETRTYGQIAASAGNPKASRAVGMANHKNPIMILIPCHRVIGSNGKLTGYAGGLEKKEFLLELERNIRQNHMERG